MKLRKICALFLIVSAFTVFPALNNLSAVTLQELLDQKSDLTVEINNIENDKRWIANRINEIASTINAQRVSKTLTDQQIVELELEYNNLFKTIEKLSDKWIELLYKMEDITNEIEKMRAEENNKVNSILHI